jgi:amino acid transporter
VRHAMARSSLGKADRFYTNPVVRDAEWNRAKSAPWWLISVVLLIVAVSFFVGAYGQGTTRATGWVIGLAALGIYMLLDKARRRRARRELRKAHGQPVR